MIVLRGRLKMHEMGKNLHFKQLICLMKHSLELMIQWRRRKQRRKEKDEREDGENELKGIGELGEKGYLQRKDRQLPPTPAPDHV